MERSSRPCANAGSKLKPFLEKKECLAENNEVAIILAREATVQFYSVMVAMIECYNNNLIMLTGICFVAITDDATVCYTLPFLPMPCREGTPSIIVLHFNTGHQLIKA